MARGGCGDCPEDSPLVVARRRYDEAMSIWSAAQAELLAEVARSGELPAEVARRLSLERQARADVLEAQEALNRILVGRR